MFLPLSDRILSDGTGTRSFSVGGGSDCEFGVADDAFTGSCGRW